MDSAKNDALRDAEERYRALFDVLDDGYCLIQLLFDASGRAVDYRFLEANPSFEEHTGLRNALGRTVRELVPDLDESWFRLYGNVALTGEKVRFENHAPAMGRWFDVSATRVGAPEDRLVALFFKNVTEQKRAEAERERLHRELEASRNRLHSLFENAPALVASLRGPEHVFEMVNPLYRRLVGMERKLIGRTVREAFPEILEQGFLERLDAVYGTGEPFIGREVPLQLDRDGGGKMEHVFLNFVYQPHRDAEGQIIGIDAFGFEVTAEVEGRKRAEALARQLRENEAQRQRHADFEQQLIGIVSHDLRNPINAITLSAATLLRRPDLDERQRKPIGRILNSADRATRMIRDLLDFTRARLVGGLVVTPRPMDFHAFAEQVVDEVQVTQASRRIHVEQQGDGWGVWDSDRMAQVLDNLLSNALHYSPPESTVVVRTRGEPDAVMLEVHNDGEPIPADTLPRLFQPMQRGTSLSNTTSRSVGLGLYIVDQVVRAHGGDIQVRSTAEEGTTFTVRLPRKAPSP